MSNRAVIPALAAASLAAAAPAQDQNPEARGFASAVQLTAPADFAKAGEAYFSPDASWVIFQAVPAGSSSEAHYSMYVAKLERDGGGAVTGLGEPIRVSEPGSANTCGWFHPQIPHRVIFGSTVEPFSAETVAGYQRESSDYAWLFPETMDVVTRTIPAIYRDRLPEGSDRPTVVWGKDARASVPLWERDGYDAECAYSPDGRYIVHTQVDPGTGDGDIYIHDTRTGKRHPIVTEKGYDGGPFFSPGGDRICYRSDRRGDDVLQLFVADLAFDEDGVPRLKRERAITNNEHVNWAPFWDPTGSFLIYTTSEVSHRNYELFAIEVPPANAGDVDPGSLAKRRITHAPGFDGMPVFSTDGSLMMWTSQRGEGRSSQVWVAEAWSLAP